MVRPSSGPLRESAPLKLPAFRKFGHLVEAENYLPKKYNEKTTLSARGGGWR